MTCYVFCLGVNHYTDSRITPLKCAENDARKVAAAFEFRYGCVSEYLEERSSEQIIDRINLLGEQLQAGDQFIFYFSGHGKVVNGEQLLLLPGCKLHLLEQHHACLRWITLKTIIAQPQWQGVQCLFIVDACRLPLEANKSAGVAEFEDGVLLRDPIFVKKSQTASHAPLSLFHSCAEGASAAEIPALKAGIFTQALLDLIKAGAEPPPLFDERFAGQVAVRMQAIANVHGVAGLHQQPVWVGVALALIGRARPHREEPQAAEPPPRPKSPEPPKQTPSAPPQNTAVPTRWPAYLASVLVVMVGLWVGFLPGKKEEPVVAAPAAPAAEAAAASAVDSGPTGVAEQNALGHKYYGEKNYPEAVKWFRKAAEQGHAAGQANLGTMYENGSGVKRDYAEAAKWYRKADEQGFVGVQNNLGVIYENGEDVNQDHGEAVKWYRKAADQGNPTGQYNLGLMYKDGKGVEKNLEAARTWLQKAANQGHKVAAARLVELNQ